MELAQLNALEKKFQNRVEIEIKTTCRLVYFFRPPTVQPHRHAALMTLSSFIRELEKTSTSWQRHSKAILYTLCQQN